MAACDTSEPACMNGGNTLSVSVRSHMYQWFSLSPLQPSAAAIQEVQSMVAQWETASTSTMSSALFVIGVMRWRGLHVLSVRPTASGATRPQRVKVGRKVKCITPNLIFPKPLEPSQLLSFRSLFLQPELFWLPSHYTPTLFNINNITAKDIFNLYRKESLPFKKKKKKLFWGRWIQDTHTCCHHLFYQPSFTINPYQFFLSAHHLLCIPTII